MSYARCKPLPALLAEVAAQAAEMAARAHLASSSPEMALVAREWAEFAEILRDAIDGDWD